MRIFVAGATGAIGRRLVPLLITDGHEVIGLARSREKVRFLESMGAKAALADPLDREALSAAVRNSRPEAVIHELTAISAAADFKNLDREFHLTNRFRTEVTDTLLAAARAAGARRLIAQSFCGWPFARQGGPVKSEEDPLDPHPPEHFRETLAAIRHLEQAIQAASDLRAIALRYGILYGPGTAIASDGVVVELLRQRKLPLVGDGAGVWSLVHIDDAARATAAAVRRGSPGLYNIVDDDPAPVAAWLPALAAAVSAEPPRKVPAWMARLAIGDGGVVMMTEIRGGSNEKAKRELEWPLNYPSWRQGFLEGLGGN